MAHLRRNHHKASGGSSRFLIVLLVIGVLLFLLLYKGRPYLDKIFYKSSNQIIFDPDSSEKIENKSQNSTFKRHPTFSHIPSFSGELLIHDYHILSFS
ncbi:MAG TPA: hypothetical protein PKD85_08990, partial [Saprospiraceae bacterium]|nr:hypothetical protein [Saprospiraceae bacterium]